ncbi:MAG: hypothetical protein NTX38_17925 [Methylobacter sp.]|nr:hypothetical protein [Methylobacter sp.]
MTTNLINGELPLDQQQAILQALTDIQAKLPFLIDLTTADRRSLPKMGAKSRGFVDQGLVLATQNSGILPRNFDIDQYNREVLLVRQLEPIVLALRQLMKRVEDTFMAAGSEAYTQTLMVYQAAKISGKTGALDEHLDSLAQRFAHKSPGPDKSLQKPE